MGIFMVIHVLAVLFLENSEVEASECYWNSGSSYTENEVNYCAAIQREFLASCMYFDASNCGNKTCLLGYETDNQGCTISCQCKTQGLFQGDIMVKEEQLANIEGMFADNPINRGASKIYHKWTYKRSRGRYLVPYVFSRAINETAKTKQAIWEAFQQFSRHTCLRFVPRRNSAPHYLKFIADPMGCWSHIGLTGGEQEISIGEGCDSVGIVLHELMHSMGFFHEQSRPDRDDFVRVIEENINPEHLHDFKKYSYSEIDSLGSPYDFNSIMHYDGKDFSKDPSRLWTIVYKNTYRPVVAQREGFSQEDVYQLNKMYNC